MSSTLRLALNFPTSSLRFCLPRMQHHSNPSLNSARLPPKAQWHTRKGRCLKTKDLHPSSAHNSLIPLKWVVIHQAISSAAQTSMVTTTCTILNIRMSMRHKICPTASARTICTMRHDRNTTLLTNLSRSAQPMSLQGHRPSTQTSPRDLEVVPALCSSLRAIISSQGRSQISWTRAHCRNNKSSILRLANRHPCSLRVWFTARSKANSIGTVSTITTKTSHHRPKSLVTHMPSNINSNSSSCPSLTSPKLSYLLRSNRLTHLWPTKRRQTLCQPKSSHTKLLIMSPIESPKTLPGSILETAIKWVRTL